MKRHMAKIAISSAYQRMPQHRAITASSGARAWRRMAREENNAKAAWHGEGIMAGIRRLAANIMKAYRPWHLKAKRHRWRKLISVAWHGVALKISEK